MSSPIDQRLREGSLEAPTRHPLDWQDPGFYNRKSLLTEMERVFDICHGCRRCFSLCQAFPGLFDAIDESDTMEIDGITEQVYWDVTDHCYLCDMCFMTKCPYVPPHEWNVDFPHLMLRAKAVKFRERRVRRRDKILTSTDTVGRLAGIPVVVDVVNAVNRSRAGRKVLQKTLGVHPGAKLPQYHNPSFRKSFRPGSVADAEATTATRGKAALFATCYGNFNNPQTLKDLVAVLEHNKIPVTLVGKEVCCGMPKLELGDLAAVEKAKQVNVPALLNMVNDGWDIVAPIPSCVLMFKQELPLMYPDDASVQKLGQAIFDPFEYLALRHKDGKLNTQFKNTLGTVAYHVPCHLRVQNIGLKTRDILSLVPDTKLEVIERCSGHDGTYAVKQEYHEASMKICRPVVNRVRQAKPDHYASDCPMAGDQIASGLNDGSEATAPITLLRHAYGV